MSELNHQEARALLENLRSDHSQGRVLKRHLEGCQDCQEYAARLRNLEDRLRAAFRSWPGINPRLDTALIIKRGASRQRQASHAKTFAKLAFAPAMAAVILFLAYFVRPDQFAANPTGDLSAKTPVAAYSNTPTPTPSSTAVAATLPACQQIVYVVQEKDTLEDIASRFGSPPAVILEENRVSEIRPGMALRIMACYATPTGLPGTPTLTSTAAKR